MSIKMRTHAERAQRVILFMEEGAGDFPANSKGGTLVTGIRAELANLSTSAVAKSTGKSRRQQGTAGRRDTRTTLRELIDSIVRTSKSVARERPEIKGTFEFTGKERSDAALIATARAFADLAPPFVSLLVEYGLPTTLADELRAGADSLEQNMTLQAEGTSVGVSITASADETIRNLSDLIERLDPIVRNKYRADPAKITAWERARRVESAARSKDNGKKKVDG